MVQSTHIYSFDPTLICEGLTATQGGMRLYENVSFSLCEGSVVAVTAPNGAGKTTLLKHIAGISTTEHQGQVTWFEKPVRSMRDYESDIVYLSDKNGLYPDWTVRQQLHYFAQGWGEALRIKPAAHYFGLEPFMEMRISHLSAGWKRRVALSRLLIIPSLLWILDEPMIHLDKDGLNLLGGMIHSHAEHGGVAIIAMPEADVTYKLYNLPVVVLQLMDFVPSMVEESSI